MLDILFNPQKAQRHPIEIIFIGIFYSSLSVFLGSWIFESSRSISIIFLTVISCLYVVQGAIRAEEKKERGHIEEERLLREHRGTIYLILFLFIGFTISFTLWAFFLPQDTALKVFSSQKVSVEKIRMITGNAVSANTLAKIFLNNVKVVAVSLIFALAYGAGAIYILVWNASVMGYVIGTIAKGKFGFAAIPFVMFKYLLHGIPEMLAYIVAAFAGGILYFAFIRGDLVKKEKIKKITIDTAILLLISFALLAISAVIEVYVSSLI